MSYISHISLHSLLPVTYAVVLQGRRMESSVLEIRVAASALLRGGCDNGLTHPSVRTLHTHTYAYVCFNAQLVHVYMCMYVCYYLPRSPLLVVQLVECVLGHMSPPEARVFLPIWSLVAHPSNFASAQKIINAHFWLNSVQGFLCFNLWWCLFWVNIQICALVRINTDVIKGSIVEKLVFLI